MTAPTVGPARLRTDPVPPARGRMWALLGVVGILLVALGVVADLSGLLEKPASWWRLFITVPGHALLLLAWWQLGPRMRRPLVVLAVWSLAMVLLPPLHSRDAYSYVAQGWLMNHGLDPYVVPSGRAGDPGLLVGVHWFETTSVYPALSLKLFQAISWISGGDPYLGVVLMRLPNLVALAVMAWVLPRLARPLGVERRTVLWAGLLNPVVVVQWVGGIHNDAVMVALLALALLLATDGGWRGWRGLITGAAVLGVSMGIKQSSAVAGLGLVALAWQAAHPALPEAARRWFNLAARAAVGGLVAVATFLGISFATGLGLGWSNDTAGNPLDATSNSPISWIASFIRFHEVLPAHLVTSTLTVVSVVLVCVALAVLLVRHGPRPPASVGRPWVVTVGSLAAFAFLGPALQPWYLTWWIPFFVLALPGGMAQRAFLVATCSFAVLPGMQDVVAPYTAMTLLLMPVWFWWRHLARMDFRVLPPVEGPQEVRPVG